MRPASFRFRIAALLAASGLAVHQLRYLIGYGAQSPHALAGQGHEYLSFVVPPVMGLVVLAAAAFALRLLEARRSPVKEPSRPHVRLLWSLSSLSLALVFCVQESLEGALVSGHPTGLQGVFGHGGWIAIVLAILFGGLVAILARGASLAIERVSALRRWRGRGASQSPRTRPSTRAPVLLDVLSAHLAGRGPPLAFV
jgi:hypothetical protein